MKKMVLLLVLASLAFISEASLVTSIDTNTPYGGNVDLADTSYTAWGYDVDGLGDRYHCQYLCQF